MKTSMDSGFINEGEKNHCDAPEIPRSQARAWNYNIRNRLICYGLILGIVCLPMRQSKADFPILTGIFIGVVAGVIVNAISERPSTETTTITQDSTPATSITITRSDPKIDIPADFISQGLLMEPGYVYSETNTFGPDGASAYFDSITNFYYSCNVLDPNFQALYPGSTACFDVTRTNEFIFVATNGAGIGAGTFFANFTIIGMHLSTTNIPGTIGAAGFDLTLQCAQLGTLFHSAGWVVQGTMPEVSGDIPASAYLSAPGSLTLNTFTNQVLVPISTNFNELDCIFTFRTWGVGRTNSIPRPVVTRTALSGTSFTFSGTNGTPIVPYAVLATTNLALPLANWTVLATSAFDTNGMFAFTAPIRKSAPATYYRLQAF